MMKITFLSLSHLPSQKLAFNQQKRPFPTTFQIFRFLRILLSSPHVQGFHKEERESETEKALSEALRTALCSTIRLPRVRLADWRSIPFWGNQGMFARASNWHFCSTQKEKLAWVGTTKDFCLRRICLLWEWWLPLRAPWQGEVLCCCTLLCVGSLCSRGSWHPQHLKSLLKSLECLYFFCLYLLTTFRIPGQIF